MKYQMSGEVSFRIVVEANSEDEAMELLESDYGILNDDERVDLKWLNVEEMGWYNIQGKWFRFNWSKTKYSNNRNS